MQLLQQIIESWSRGQGEPDAFILRIIVSLFHILVVQVNTRIR